MIADSLPRNRTKVALLVMGVGRSGTSALARVLNLLGATIPSKTFAPDSGNERGYWEPTSINALSEAMLSLHSSDWYDTRSFPGAWFSSPEAAEFVERARSLIQDEYAGAGLIVIKEPRICRLAPVYLAALERAGYAPRVVIPLRHPSEVVASLKRRDGADERTSELIWIRHMLEMEAATRHCPRVWTTYEQLVEDWWSVQAKIASGLGLTWPNPPEVVAPGIEAFLAPALRHFDVGKEPAAWELGPIASGIWKAAQAGLAGDEAALRQRFDDIGADIKEIDRLGAPQVAGERAAKIAAAANLAKTASALAAAETALAAERQARDASEARAASLEARLRELQGRTVANAARPERGPSEGSP